MKPGYRRVDFDVRKKLIVSCFRKGDKQEGREPGITARELLGLADWIKKGGQ